METTKILYNLLGTNDYSIVLIGFVYAMIGVLLSLLIHSNKRDPNTQNSPIKFSWGFFLKDNLKRVLTGLILILIFMRFSTELIGKDPTVYSSFLIGFMSDKLIEILKSKIDLI